MSENDFRMNFSYSRLRSDSLGRDETDTMFDADLLLDSNPAATSVRRNSDTMTSEERNNAANAAFMETGSISSSASTRIIGDSDIIENTPSYFARFLRDENSLLPTLNSDHLEFDSELIPAEQEDLATGGWTSRFKAIFLDMFFDCLCCFYDCISH